MNLLRSVLRRLLRSDHRREITLGRVADANALRRDPPPQAPTPGGPVF